MATGLRRDHRRGAPLLPSHSYECCYREPLPSGSQRRQFHFGLNLHHARILIVATPKRPLAPAATALFVFISVPLVVTLGGMLTKSNMVALGRGIQGAFTLGVFLAILSYFL